MGKILSKEYEHNHTVSIPEVKISNNTNEIIRFQLGLKTPSDNQFYIQKYVYERTVYVGTRWQDIISETLENIKKTTTENLYQTKKESKDETELEEYFLFRYDMKQRQWKKCMLTDYVCKFSEGQVYFVVPQSDVGKYGNVDQDMCDKLLQSVGLIDK